MTEYIIHWLWSDGVHAQLFCTLRDVEREMSCPILDTPDCKVIHRWVSVVR